MDTAIPQGSGIQNCYSPERQGRDAWLFWDRSMGETSSATIHRSLVMSAAIMWNRNGPAVSRTQNGKSGTVWSAPQNCNTEIRDTVKCCPCFSSPPFSLFAEEIAFRRVAGH